MSLFGIDKTTTKPRPKSYRPQRSPSELEQIRKNRWLAKLEREAPADYDAYMKRKHFGGLGAGAEDAPDSIQTTADTIGRLKALNLWPEDPSRAGEGGSGLLELGKVLAQVLAPVLVQSVMQQQQPAAPQIAAPAVQVLPPPQLEPAPAPQIAAPTAPAAPRPNDEDSDDGPTLPEPEQTEGEDMISFIVKQQLAGKTPRQAAQLLMKYGAQYPQFAGPLLVELQKTPDAQLPAAMARYGQQYPQFAGVVSWLAQYPEWLAQVAMLLRAAQPTASGSRCGDCPQ